MKKIAYNLYRVSGKKQVHVTIDNREDMRELDILLNMDEKDHEILEAEPDEGDLAHEPRSRGMER